MAFVPGEAALPGATIAQQDAAANQAAKAKAGAFGHQGPPRKVATPLGSVKYKAPIGTLIVPHPHHAEPGGLKEHYIAGAPGHFDEGMSQATWVANQWKAHPEKAEKEFHRGLEKGTHKLVQAGSHEFAVHKDIDVHVPKGTDLSNPEAVKAAPKLFVKKDEEGKPAEHLVFNPNHPATSKPLEANDTVEDAKNQFWKPLHAADTEPEHKKSVSFAGKHAAYVPEDWQVFKAPDDEAKLIGKWAKAPDGTWHKVTPDGKVTPAKPAPATFEDWVKHKAIVPDTSVTHEHATLPAPGHTGPASPTVGVPGKDGEPIAVSKQDIATALYILGEDKSTAVKQPLAKKGHPLAGMDYHAVAQAELAKHPELKVPSGTKKAHVGQVKVAVTHYLSGRAAHLSKTMAEQAAAEAAQDKAKADAAEAQALTPSTLHVGGVEVTKEQVADAIAILTKNKSTSIKQPLKHAGNPLGATDYWQVVHDYETEHPAPKQHGTKQAHVGNAKATFILALQEKAGLLAKADQVSGHDQAVAAAEAPAPKVPELPPHLSPEIMPYQPPEPPAPELQGVPALTKNGEYAGEYPPGSVLYAKKSYYGKPDIYAKDPSGQWWYVGSDDTVQEVPPYYMSDSYLGGSDVTQVEPPSPEQVALSKQVAEVKDQIKNGAMLPGSSGGVFPTWQEAAAYAVSTGNKGGGSVSIAPVAGGFAYAYSSSADEHYSIDPASLEVSYFPPGQYYGNDKPAPDLKLQQQLMQQVKASVVPGSVLIGEKLHQFGFYKNPKGSSYLKIAPEKSNYPEYWKYGSAAYATYVYVGANGEPKVVTPNYAKKTLEKATEFSATEPVKEVKPTELVTHATVLKPGVFKLWSVGEDAPSSSNTLDVKEDSSAVVSGTAPDLPFDAEDVASLVAGGAVLDQYGTTVVKPGQPVAGYHVWGSKAKTPEQLQAHLDQVLQPDVQFAPTAKDFLTGGGVSWADIMQYGKPYMADHGGVNGDSQRVAYVGLLTELLAVPKLPADAKLAAGPGKAKPEGPVFLKEYPPGIPKAELIFTYHANGTVLPFQGTMPQYPAAETVPELKAKIKEVSQEFGGGQVVGTHLSGLNASDLSSWLDAWKSGDMAKVFALDAKGGKVSPAHPGAPDNTATHQVTWSAKDPGQVPASQDILGAWSDLTVTELPPLEVNNYLVKMVFQHAEYLTAHEKQQVVRAHRTHQQAVVDNFTGLANERLAAGQAPLTEVPVWTDGLKPAKAYDSYLQNKTPADEWTVNAYKAFAKDHAAELLPYLDEVAQENGYSEGGQFFLDNQYYSYISLGIQKWLDEAHAKVVAEQSVPVWKKVPADIKESHGHEVLKATKTIPYTGEVTTYFVKPAPGGEVFRLEQEHAANLLGRLFGFSSAESLLLNEKALGPGLVQAQKQIPGQALGFYTDLPPWSAFTDVQVADIAMEHVLDHVLANDDSSANNMIKTPAGRIVGIDKGRAWGNMSWDSLSGTSSMDSMTQLVYTKLYNGIRSHQVTKDQADKAFLAVVARARKMANVSDASVQKILEAGFANRTKFGSFKNAQGLIDEVLRRKNSLEADFTKLWGQVYKDAGIGPLPEVPEQKLPDAHGSPLHAGFSDPGLLEHVVAGKSHGVPVFFGGYELSDMHFLLHQEQHQGTTVTQGEAFLRGHAYDKVVAFLKKHAHGEPLPANDTKTSYGSDSNGPLYPPYGSADRGGIDGERGFFADIIGAARTLTKHAADGQYNQAKMDALETTRTKLEGLQAGFGAAVAANPDSTEPDIVTAKNGLDMAKHYLGLIAKLDAAKTGSYGLAEGDLLRWLPKDQPKPAEEPKDELAAMGITLTVRQGDAWHNAVISEAGDKVTGASTNTDAGKYWVMTLPGGEEIHVGDGQEMGVQVAQWGRVRFTTPEHTAASLENVRAALQLAGLELPDAEAHHFEQFYWRFMLATLADRKDAAKQPVWKSLVDQFTALGLEPKTGSPKAVHRHLIDQLAALPPEQEAEVYRTAFATLTSPEQVQEFADKGGFFPVQKHFDPRAPQVAGGKPDWYRFDLLPQAASMPMPTRHGTGGDYGESVVKSGGSYSTDALHRVAGQFASGMGNPASSGGPRYVFTGLNLTSNRSLVFTPLAAMRSHNYSYTDDSFGNIVESSKGGYSGYPARHEAAYWDPKVWSKYSGSSNETMINDALSFLDDVELVVEHNPQQVVKWLHDQGITHIRHMPVEDRIVSHIGPAELAKVKANLAAHPELLDPFATDQHGLPGAAEPPAVAAEAKAEKAALDTEAAAQAAEHGTPGGNTVLDSPPSSPPPDIKDILSSVMTASLGPGWSKFGEGGWKKPGVGSILENNPGSGTKFYVYDANEHYVGSFDSLDQAHQAVEPDGGAGWKPTAVPGYPVGEHWESSQGQIFKGHSTGKFLAYQGTDMKSANLLGAFDTLEEAQKAVEGA